MSLSIAQTDVRPLRNETPEYQYWVVIPNWRRTGVIHLVYITEYQVRIVAWKLWTKFISLHVTQRKRELCLSETVLLESLLSTFPIQKVFKVCQFQTLLICKEFQSRNTKKNMYSITVTANTVLSNRLILVWVSNKSAWDASTLHCVLHRALYPAT